MSLAAYIAALNAESQAWVAEDPENRWSSGVIDDLDFWAKQGITTVEEFRFSSAVSEYSDSYKEMYGIRPRWMDFTGATAAEVEAEVKKLYAERAEQAAKEAAEQARIDDACSATREAPTGLTHNPFAILLAK